MEETKERKYLKRLTDIYYAKAVKKMNNVEIARAYNITPVRIGQLIKRFEKISAYNEITVSQAIAFYEDEIKYLMAKRYHCSPKLISPLTKAIHNAQDKICELSRLIDIRKTVTHNEMKVNNYVQIYRPEPYPEDDCLEAPSREADRSI